MTVESIKRRLARLGESTAASRNALINSTIEHMHQLAKARRGQPYQPDYSPLPPLPAGATASERRTWEIINEGRARVGAYMEQPQ